MYAYGTTNRHPGSGPPKSCRTSIYSQVDAPHSHSVLCGAHIVVHFNYVKFAETKSICYKLSLMCAKNYQIWYKAIQKQEAPLPRSARRVCRA